MTEVPTIEQRLATLEEELRDIKELDEFGYNGLASRIEALEVFQQNVDGELHKMIHSIDRKLKDMIERVLKLEVEMSARTALFNKELERLRIARDLG